MRSAVWVASATLSPGPWGRSREPWVSTPCVGTEEEERVEEDVKPSCPDLELWGEGAGKSSGFKAKTDRGPTPPQSLRLKEGKSKGLGPVDWDSRRGGFPGGAWSKVGG